MVDEAELRELLDTIVDCWLVDGDEPTTTDNPASAGQPAPEPIVAKQRKFTVHSQHDSKADADRAAKALVPIFIVGQNNSSTKQYDRLCNEHSGCRAATTKDQYNCSFVVRRQWCAEIRRWVVKVRGAHSGASVALATAAGGVHPRWLPFVDSHIKSNTAPEQVQMSGTASR